MSLVLDTDVSDAECLKLGISRGLGIGTVGASSVVLGPADPEPPALQVRLGSQLPVVPPRDVRLPYFAGLQLPQRPRTWATMLSTLVVMLASTGLFIDNYHRCEDV